MQNMINMLLLEVHAVTTRLGILNKVEVIRGQPKRFENTISQLQKSATQSRIDELHDLHPSVCPSFPTSPSPEPGLSSQEAPEEPFGQPFCHPVADYPWQQVFYSPLPLLEDLPSRLAGSVL